MLLNLIVDLRHRMGLFFFIAGQGIKNKTIVWIYNQAACLVLLAASRKKKSISSSGSDADAEKQKEPPRELVCTLLYGPKFFSTAMEHGTRMKPIARKKFENNIYQHQSI
ncbi:hypothetical protein MRX96_028510 [Rhipicephalus microplus]